MPSPDHLLETLPKNSRFETIDYIPLAISRADGQQDSPAQTASSQVIRLPPALSTLAVIGRSSVLADANESIHREIPSFTLLSVPANELSEEQALGNIQDWVAESNREDSELSEASSLMLNLQNAKVFWSPQRIAVIAEEGRLETVRKSIIEVTFYVGELKSIELALAHWWAQLEIDTPLAFEFAEQDLPKQKELQKRFQEIISLRARLARVTPFLLAPHAYPPTLASQIGERLRERVRVHEQCEFVSDQIEVFEKVYEMCGQRASDYRQARTGHTLEWIIIILLAAEVILMAFDYLSVARA
jgi:hypothetical protein